MIEGEWSGRFTGLRDQRVEIAMMRMPDGHGRTELSRFFTPPTVADHRNAPVNALGYLPRHVRQRVPLLCHRRPDSGSRSHAGGATPARRDASIHAGFERLGGFAVDRPARPVTFPGGRGRPSSMLCGELPEDSTGTAPLREPHSFPMNGLG